MPESPDLVVVLGLRRVTKLLTHTQQLRTLNILILKTAALHFAPELFSSWHKKHEHPTSSVNFHLSCILLAFCGHQIARQHKKKKLILFLTIAEDILASAPHFSSYPHLFLTFTFFSVLIMEGGFGKLFLRVTKHLH